MHNGLILKNLMNINKKLKIVDESSPLRKMYQGSLSPAI
ncbi:hypothetical protein BC792_102166 [Sphingobacterium allocomposti]|uniref:Uncharacterized protein n=1 Tax=Sphingobacterium allocomposti TaxID=415956 RepID=A0A5S5DPZ0_9SPHI|nr:hypothetical protein BC792_102166 [Sphingobacterium composti Yoo et al. 2007 non Ten et al. 2007]